MKFVQKNKIELSDTALPDLFILNYMNVLQGIDVKVYLYILFLCKNGKEIEISAMAKKMGVSEQEISFSLDRLQTEDLIIKTTHGFNIVDIKEAEVNKSYIPKMEPKKTKTQTETERKRIAAASAINESFFQGVMSLGWYTDIGTMFENYKLSEEVMIALFHYCQERKALNKKYVHAVAETWYKGGVRTFEELETFLENYDKILKIKQKISKALRLNRNFTKYEEQYIDMWIKDFKYDFDMIEEALKRTVSKTNPTISYVNGILSNWNKKGFKNVKDLEEEKAQSLDKTKAKPYAKTTKPKTKYQNYEQRDYEDLESFYDNV
ncbi:MAG: DnaD domain protein [Clostridia bacterium]